MLQFPLQTSIWHLLIVIFFHSTIARHFTTAQTTAKVCTHSGQPCQFPFEYGDKMYYTCVESIAYSWCYTDASMEEYTYCKPCTESFTSTISTISTAITTPITTSANVMSTSSAKPPKTPVPKGFTSTISTISTATSTPTTTSANVMSTSSAKPPKTPVPKDSISATSTTPATTSTSTTTSRNAMSTSFTKRPKTPVTKGSIYTTSTTPDMTSTSTTTSTNSMSTSFTKRPKTSVPEETTSRVLSGHYNPGEAFYTITVPIIVEVLSVLAALVAFATLFLYIRNRRSSRRNDPGMIGNVEEPVQGLLSHNQNGNHTSIDDGSSREMQPLKSNPREENAVYSGAGVDRDVVNKKEDETSANVTV